MLKMRISSLLSRGDYLTILRLLPTSRVKYGDATAGYHMHFKRAAL